MEELTPVERYSHANDNPVNVNVEYKDMLTTGQKAADWVARVAGSWKFIIGQSVFLFLWATVNVCHFCFQWDPYPFTLMNLVLSLEAAFTGPIIMMSQNRQAAKDRLTAESDFDVDQRSERELKVIMDQLKYMTNILERQ